MHSEHWMSKSVITRKQIMGTAYISVHVGFKDGKGGDEYVDFIKM
jgi:hypothetical protein